MQLAEARDAGVAEDNGDALRRQAAALHTLYGLYRLYAHIRRTQPVGFQRTHSLDEVAMRMQHVGMTTEFDPVEVASWFDEGDDGLRVVALDIMLVRNECRDLLAALGAITEPRSSFEQYYGLVLARTMAPDLSELEKQVLRDSIQHASGKRRFRRDPSLDPLSRKSSPLFNRASRQIRRRASHRTADRYSVQQLPSRIEIAEPDERIRVAVKSDPSVGLLSEDLSHAKHPRRLAFASVESHRAAIDVDDDR